MIYLLNESGDNGRLNDDDVVMVIKMEDLRYFSNIIEKKTIVNLIDGIKENTKNIKLVPIIKMEFLM